MNLLLRPVFVEVRHPGGRRRHQQLNPPRPPKQPRLIYLRGRVEGRSVSAGFVFGTASSPPDDDGLLLLDLL